MGLRRCVPHFVAGAEKTRRSTWKRRSKLRRSRRPPAGRRPQPKTGSAFPRHLDRSNCSQFKPGQSESRHTQLEGKSPSRRLGKAIGQTPPGDQCPLGAIVPGPRAPPLAYRARTPNRPPALAERTTLEGRKEEKRRTSTLLRLRPPAGEKKRRKEGHPHC